MSKCLYVNSNDEHHYAWKQKMKITFCLVQLGRECEKWLKLDVYKKEMRIEVHLSIINEQMKKQKFYLIKKYEINSAQVLLTS